jgi:hypothetical protein
MDDLEKSQITKLQIPKKTQTPTTNYQILIARFFGVWVLAFVICARLAPNDE